MFEVFWPANVIAFDYYSEPDSEAVRLMGEIVDEETVSRSRAGNPGYEGDTVKRNLLKTGNRDVSGLDFRWILSEAITELSPEKFSVDDLDAYDGGYDEDDGEDDGTWWISFELNGDFKLYTDVLKVG